MDWAKQTQEMFQNWSDVQMKAWKNWLDTVQGGEKMDPAKMWQETLDAWQTSVTGSLDAQVESSKIWAEGIADVKGAPKETTEWAKQVQEMTEQWTSMQKQLWDSWFEAVKEADPSKFAGNWGDMDQQNLLKSWQDIAQKAMDSQTQWAKSLTDMIQPKKDEG